jgi:hypothetical protein
LLVNLSQKSFYEIDPKTRETIFGVSVKILKFYVKKVSKKVILKSFMKISIELGLFVNVIKLFFVEIR